MRVSWSTSLILGLNAKSPAYFFPGCGWGLLRVGLDREDHLEITSCTNAVSNAGTRQPWTASS